MTLSEEKLKYFIHTYGCQMNIHDSEKIAGILESMGYFSTDQVEDADVVVFNTCCIRETAEQKIYGHIGAIKKLKRAKPDLIAVVCGCMSQQEGVAEKIRTSYPFVDIVLGTSNLFCLHKKRKKYSMSNFLVTAKRTSRNPEQVIRMLG